VHILLILESVQISISRNVDLVAAFLVKLTLLLLVAYFRLLTWRKTNSTQK